VGSLRERLFLLLPDYATPGSLSYTAEIGNYLRSEFTGFVAVGGFRFPVSLWSWR